MSSENFPHAPETGSDQQPAEEQRPAPCDGPDQYPPAHNNTGVYRRPLPGQPDQESSAGPAAADAGPPPNGSAPYGVDPHGTDPHGSDSNTGPLDAVPAQVWQSRPSGALAAGTGAVAYGAGASGAESYSTGSYGQQAYGQPHETTQFGTAYHPGIAGAVGYPGSFQPTAAPGAAPGGSVATATRRPGRTKRAASVAALTAVLLGGGFGAGYWGGHVADDNAAATDSSLSQQVPSPVVSNVQPVSGGVEAVANKLLPSVVSILSISSSQSGEGSGVILSPDGLILTNNHVIAGATDLTVKFNDGHTATAKVIGADATDDLAVIKASGVSGLTVATFGSSAKVKVGQQVVAVGSPLGLSATVTSGIVSALNRPVRTAAEQSQQQTGSASSQNTVLNAIQTDAAINPGNSGGALVDMSGAVVGINSAIASLSSGSGQSGSIGVGFAIPIDQARRIAQEILNTGHANHAVLGASVGDAPDSSAADPTKAAQAGLSVGAKVASLVKGGGAEAAGLQAGDVITKIADTPVGSADALIATVRSSAPGGKVAITYLRGSETKTTTVTLGSAVSE